MSPYVLRLLRPGISTFHSTLYTVGVCRAKIRTKVASRLGSWRFSQFVTSVALVPNAGARCMARLDQVLNIYMRVVNCMCNIEIYIYIYIEMHKSYIYLYICKCIQVYITVRAGPGLPSRRYRTVGKGNASSSTCLVTL